jgi:acetolactate synthase-1/2/3 large subunit
VSGAEVFGGIAGGGAPRGSEYTTSTALLEALREAGARYAFANLGSDHTGMMEAYALAKSAGTLASLPELILCPHESVALSAAHGYALVTGEPQAVLVHVDAGTLNLGGAIHNAAKGRVPVLIFAGLSPMTQDSELPGTRSEHIHWLQDNGSQRAIMRGYTKYDNEIRTGLNAKQLVHRAMQIARSDPAGPVYLVSPREVLEEELPPQPPQGDWWSPVAPAALTAAVADEIAAALEGARSPLIVTSYLGRDPAAVAELVRLCELAGVAVIESAPMHLNFPDDHPLHLGYQWNVPEQNPLLADADVILVLGSDVPWIPGHNRPDRSARIYVVDVDPLKTQIQLWYVAASRYAMADLGTAVRQIAGRLTERGRLDPAAVQARAERVRATHDVQRARWAAREQPGADGTITPEYLVACVRDCIGPDAIVLNEAISNYPAVSQHLRASRPGSVLGIGGGSLGWSGGAAVGVKLAAPERTVVSLVGDGSYLFGVPSSAQWMARRYQAPSLTVIFDNQGWKTPSLSALAVHPEGRVAGGGFAASFQPGADLAGIAAAAGGAYARTVTAADLLPVTLRRAVEHVTDGQSAVISVRLPPV